MVFENKFEISVQWGPGNYCERKDDEMVENIVNFWDSCSADIAVFNNKGGFVSIGEEDMVIYEMQYGECLEEDIIRIEDKYGR